MPESLLDINMLWNNRKESDKYIYEFIIANDSTWLYTEKCLNMIKVGNFGRKSDFILNMIALSLTTGLKVEDVTA